jgi:hypothetical protein
VPRRKFKQKNVVVISEMNLSALSNRVEFEWICQGVKSNFPSLIVQNELSAELHGKVARFVVWKKFT